MWQKSLWITWMMSIMADIHIYPKKLFFRHAFNTGKGWYE